MTCFDELAEKAGDDQWDEWKEIVLDAKEEIADFVASQRPGRGAEVVGHLQGSFNLCLQITYSDGTPSTVVRLSGPGHSTFRDEKILNEVRVIQFLQDNTTIPVPRLISWGTTERSPKEFGKEFAKKFGPFMISDFVEGTHLSDILKDPSDKKKTYLNPNIDKDTLENVFSQLAEIMLQLYQFNFDHIGAISKSPCTGAWSVTGRPLTYSMSELATAASYPSDKFPMERFESASEYFQSLTVQHKIHLWTQRNLCEDPADARDRYVSRHLFAQLIDKHCTDDRGPFKLFCDDFRPQNILVDPNTLRIKAVLDLEFTNAMPSQFASEPPWWLVLAGPDNYVIRGRSIAEFIEAYEPRLDQFLEVMERVEKTRGTSDCHRPLSCLMRESWATKRFWFSYGARKPFDVDEFYNGCLKDDNDGVDCLNEETRAGLEAFVETKMKQLKAYEEDCAKAGL